jgi:hypothetical protein
MPRTYLVTALFTGAVLLFVRGVREGGSVRCGVWLLPMFAVWANVHVEFVDGWLFLGLASLEALLQGRDRRRASELAGLTVSCVAATLVNPFGARLLARLAGWMQAYGGSDIVFEMQSLPFRQPEDYVLLVLFAAAVLALGQANDRSSYRWGSLVFAAGMSFHSRRAAWMIVLVSLDAVAALPALSVTREKTGPAKIVLPLALASALGVAMFAVLASARRDALAATDEFPFAATRYAREHALAGPVYGHYNWGGFLRFELPDVPGNIDGAAAAWNGAPGWADDPPLQKAGFVVAGVRTAMAQLLRFDARFRVAYEDPVAVVFVRAR